MRKFFIAILLSLFIASVEIRPANATTVNFQWEGNTGYFAQGSFSYDEKTASITFSEQGDGKTKVLEALTVSFYDPSGQQIATYNDVVNGVSLAHYFQFNFNIVTQRVFGLIDIGGEKADEIYLKGNIHENLSLFYIEKSGTEEIIDKDSGSLLASSKQ